jgi:DNA-binding CsgD family transcriptional regulator
MRRRVVDTATEAARGIVAGEDMDAFLAESAHELWSADAGAGLVRLDQRAAGVGASVVPGGVPPLTPQMLEAAMVAAPGSVSVRGIRSAGTARPFRTSDEVDLPTYWRTEEFQALHGFYGGRFPLGAGLLLTATSAVFLGLHRSSREFTDHEVHELAALQSVVSAALQYRHALDSLLRTPTTEAGARPAGAAYAPTRREAQVLDLVSSGWTNTQVATKLGITERTVRKHLRAVFDGAGVSSRTAAAMWWARTNGVSA